MGVLFSKVKCKTSCCLFFFLLLALSSIEKVQSKAQQRFRDNNNNKVSSSLNGVASTTTNKEKPNTNTSHNLLKVCRKVKECNNTSSSSTLSSSSSMCEEKTICEKRKKDENNIQNKLKLCPIGREFPMEKYFIEPYIDVDNFDLGEVSYIAFSKFIDDEGNTYAYVASDKQQTSIKVIKFDKQSYLGQVIAVLTLVNEEIDLTEADWEDISLGPCTAEKNSDTCLFIGNIGGNNNDRSFVEIYKFQEIDLNKIPLNPSNPLELKIDVVIIRFSYGSGFLSPFNDAETLFVDWKGDNANSDDSRNNLGNAGDIYIITKAGNPYCDARVGRIPADIHASLTPGKVSDTYSMSALMELPPDQGLVTCSQSAYRPWVGGDMSSDGKLITLTRGSAVYFYPRAKKMSVKDALEGGSCPFASSTSVGLPDESKFEAVGFVSGDRANGVAETSECDNGSECNVPVYFSKLIFSKAPFYCWNVIEEQNFEDGQGSYNLDGGKVERSDDKRCNSSGRCSCEGEFSVRMGGNEGIDSSFFHDIAFDCRLYNKLRVSFQFQWRSVEHMDGFFLELSQDNGASYIIAHSWAFESNEIFDRNDRCYSDQVILKGKDFSNEDDDFFGKKVKLRFRSSSSSASDFVYIDNILFEGSSPESCEDNEILGEESL